LRACHLFKVDPSAHFSHSIGTPVNIQLVYSSKLTVENPTYYRDCEVPQCHYETVQINVNTKGLYVLWSESSIEIYGYIYNNDFNPLKPSDDLLLRHNGDCNDKQFKLIIDLEVHTRYILVVTTHHPKTFGNFSVFISGPDNVTLTHFSKYLYCFFDHKYNTIKQNKKSICDTSSISEQFLFEILKDDLRSY
jgi:hypothetical protein